jgi:SPP1 family predicted phage head-tail adaptor
MRERAILEREDPTPDEAGGTGSFWLQVAVVWANIQSCGTARRQMRDGRTTVRALWQIRIRRRRDVCSGMRIRMAGAGDPRERLYQILSVSEDAGQRRFLQCICEELY